MAANPTLQDRASRLKLTITEIAQHSGLSRITVRRVLRDSGNPRRNTIRAVEAVIAAEETINFNETMNGVAL